MFIEKEQMDNTSKVHVRLLNEKESVYELAKMISGKEITQQSIDHAKKVERNKCIKLEHRYQNMLVAKKRLQEVSMLFKKA